jgi:cytochrome c
MGRLAVLAEAGLVCASLLFSPLALAQDAASGELVFNNACRTCHTTREGDNRLGPHLHNIIGRKAGSLPNYHYSSALAGAGFIWNEENLDRFIANPDAVVPGNAMKPYGGLASVAARANVIVFLRSLSSSP